LRKMTLNEISDIVKAKGQEVDHAVHLFRAKAKASGQELKRTRPRSADEIKALNYLARIGLLTAIKEGTVRYDREKRVIYFAKYSGS
jgi:hypothetical protein